MFSVCGPCLWTGPEKMGRSACLFVVLISAHWVSGSYPRAQNVTWKSTNFKTLLMWEPKPTNYTYTVEFSVVGRDRQRNHHCVLSNETMCDLSASLTELMSCYTADILSTPPLGASPERESPHTSSTRFCPYKDTDIGKPEFKVVVNENKTTTLYVIDPLTALFKDGRQLNIRDIFSDDLQYRVIYRKNKSSGKKVYDSKTNMIQLTGLDEDSYCFSVQAYIPKRMVKELGEMSGTKCSDNKNQSITNEYSPGVIAGVVFFVLLVIIAVTVICCKCKKKTLKNGREGVPLQGV